LLTWYVTYPASPLSSSILPANNHRLQLPDLDFPINAKAESRVIVPWEHTQHPNMTQQDSSVGIEEMLGGKFIADWRGDGGSVWESWRRTCPPNSTARRLFESIRTPFSVSLDSKNYLQIQSQRRDALLCLPLLHQHYPLQAHHRIRITSPASTNTVQDPTFLLPPLQPTPRSISAPLHMHTTRKDISSPTGASSPLSTPYSPPQKLEDLATSVYLPTTTTALRRGTLTVGTKSTSSSTDFPRNIPKSTL